MQKEIVKPTTLSGFMELLPPEQIIFNKVIAILKEVYESYGFYPLDTPILEKSEVLLAKAGGETETQIYRFLKGDTDLTMRFDLTVPLAKYVAKNYNELTFPFKRYQIGKVYRGERAQKGRFREFYQADIDIVGDEELSIYNEIEIISIIYEVFKRLKINDFIIKINNRKLLTGFIQLIDLKNKNIEIMRIIDKTSKISKFEFLAELEKIGVLKDLGEEIYKFINLKDDVIKTLYSYQGKNEMFDQGLNELEQVYNNVVNFGVPSEYLAIDLSIARGLDYYTGTIYETFLLNHFDVGSVCSGGRYDDLASFYTQQKLPGVGVSIGLTRLFSILRANNYLSDMLNTPSEVLVIPLDKEIHFAYSIASFFRLKGIKSYVYFEDKKMKQILKYANRNKIRYVVFFGKKEQEMQMITFKDLDTGIQKFISLDEAFKIIIDNTNL